MSFEDLPKNLKSVPVTAEMAADVVDLFVGEQDRDIGCLAFLILDRRGIVVQPILIMDDPKDRCIANAARLWQTEEAFSGMARMTAEVDGSVIFAIGRGGDPCVSGPDRRWQRHVLRLFGELVTGCYLATPGDVRALPGFGEALEDAS